MRLFMPVSWLLIPALLGCTNQDLSDKKAVAVNHALNAASVTADDLQHPEQRGPIRPSNRLYLGGIDSRPDHGEPLPDRVQGTRSFQISKTGSYSLEDLASEIHAVTHLSVVVPDEDRSAQGEVGKAATAKAEPPPLRASDGDTIAALLAQAGAVQRAPVARFVSVYTGPLEPFLDQEVPAFGGDWQYRAGVLYLTHTLVKTYRVEDLNGETSASASLSDSGSTGSGSTSGTSTGTSSGTQSGAGGTGDVSGGGGQSTSTTVVDKSWDELVKTLGLIAGPTNVAAAQSSGVVTVRCTSFCHAQVKVFLDAHNRDVGRNIMVSVAILNIQRTGSDTYGFDPTLIYKNLPTGYSFAITGQALPTSSSGSPGTVTGGIINPPPGSTASKFNGTTLVASALTQAGHVTGVFTKTLAVGNNRVSAVQQATLVPFISSAGNNLASSGLAMTSTNIVTTAIGDQLQVVARANGDGLIRVQLALKRTTQVNTLTFDLGGGVTTPVPEVGNDSASPFQVTIPDGGTMILADVSNTSSTVANSGTGVVENILLGGSATASNSHDQTIMILSAREFHPFERQVQFAATVQ